MDQYRVPYSQRIMHITCNPLGGSIFLMSLLYALVLCFRGWPATVADAGILLAIFDLAAMFVVIFVVSEDEDWKMDMKTGLRPFERSRLINLILFHCAFALAVTVVAIAVMRFIGQVDLTLAGAIFISGVETMTVMLLGRK
jgi:hypothetical protein